ncbi:hypothetical protein GS504_00855 [Rhodococcus hoagii]|nr:hypothetical protein [Prescottella equi]NKS72208.1 hypothetical protein [Prescottella equi]
MDRNVLILLGVLSGIVLSILALRRSPAKELKIALGLAATIATATVIVFAIAQVLRI